LGNQLAPGLLDRYLASSGYKGQLTPEAQPDNAPSNLFEPVAGEYDAHGRFDEESRSMSWQFFIDRHRIAAVAGVLTLALAGASTLLAGRSRN
jgi:hypothetical protein